MKTTEWNDVTLGNLVDNYDPYRIPVAGSKRVPGPYPYYGASGIVDHVAEYIFDGAYLLLGEDGENLRSRNTPVAFIASGQFWVNNHAHILRGKPGVADTHFLMHCLNLTDLSAYLSGSAQPKLSQASMNSIRLKVPPLPEQQAIAEVLGALDDKIAANRALAATADELIHAHYTLALAEQREPRPMMEALNVTFGEAFKGEFFTARGTGRPLLRIRDIAKGSSETWTTEERPSESIIEAGTVVAGMDADFTASFWLGPPSLLNQRVCSITSDQFGSAFAREIAQPALTNIANQKSGTTVIHLNKADMLRTVVEIPTGPSARERARAANDLLDIRVAAARETATLASLRDTLLPALMDGTLCVRDAEETVSEAL